MFVYINQRWIAKGFALQVQRISGIYNNIMVTVGDELIHGDTVSVKSAQEIIFRRRVGLCVVNICPFFIIIRLGEVQGPFLNWWSMLWK